MAGLGTRFARHKVDLMPILFVGVIHYAVKAIEAGCEVLIFVVGRSKQAIVDYFDANPEPKPSLRPKINLKR